jgi:hypothetical protein
MDLSAARLRALLGTAERQGLMPGALMSVPADLRAWAGRRTPVAPGSASSRGGAEASPGRPGSARDEEARPEGGFDEGGPAAPAPLFDRVLLDAPCSGTGVLAKRADLRWRRREADLAQLAALQVRARRGRVCACVGCGDGAARRAGRPAQLAAPHARCVMGLLGGSVVLCVCGVRGALVAYPRCVTLGRHPTLT